MIDRYATPEMRALWAPETKFALWLEIELLAVEAQAERGEVPREVAVRLRQTARCGSAARIDEIERSETQHDVVAFLRSVAELTGPDASYLHHGLGSSDVVDTAQSVLLVRAADLILEALAEVRRSTAALADRHRHAIMAGRTHGMHAEPITFGVKVALWHAEYVAALAILAGTTEKIATEIRSLQRTELGEVEEPFGARQTGSSAMPHKRNPILCERLVGLARTVRGAAVVALENQALWGERDISHSSAERLIFPQATGVMHYMLRTLHRVLAGLRVFPDAMRRNLEATGGLVFSHRVLLALIGKGRSRDEAYRIVQDAGMAAVEGRGGFRELLVAGGALSPDDVDACFSLEPYLRHVDAILDRAGIPRGEGPAPAPPGLVSGGVTPRRVTPRKERAGR